MVCFCHYKLYLRFIASSLATLKSGRWPSSLGHAPESCTLSIPEVFWNDPVSAPPQSEQGACDTAPSVPGPHTEHHSTSSRRLTHLPSAASSTATAPSVQLKRTPNMASGRVWEAPAGSGVAPPEPARLIHTWPAPAHAYGDVSNGRRASPATRNASRTPRDATIDSRAISCAAPERRTRHAARSVS